MNFYIILFTGEGNDYLNVAIKDGCLSLTMGLANGKQEMQIKPNKVRFDDNQWHKVSIHRRIQEVSDWLLNAWIVRKLISDSLLILLTRNYQIPLN